jgi:hypothetical protein
LPVFGIVRAKRGSLNDTAFRKDNEALGLIGALDDYDVHALEDIVQCLLEASAIGVELQEKRIEAEQGGYKEAAAVAILHIGAMHTMVLHQRAVRVDESVPLLAFDLLARIVAMLDRSGCR